MAKKNSKRDDKFVEVIDIKQFPVAEDGDTKMEFTLDFDSWTDWDQPDQLEVTVRPVKKKPKPGHMRSIDLPHDPGCENTDSKCTCGAMEQNAENRGWNKAMLIAGVVKPSKKKGKGK